MLTVRVSVFALFVLVMSSYFFDRTHQQRSRITSYEKMKRLVSEIKAENADLKRENTRLKQMIDMMNGDFTDPPSEQSTQNTTAKGSTDKEAENLQSTNQTHTN